ncbi:MULTISPECIES: homoserine dehydrogenase [Cohaesibacter]|uniref:homoserine dehydrogenase n=1 Tax=Cohaesibacter TaxID=655352 RepID=UPI000DEBB0AF|nr:MULTISPECIES: homoserine dehydrogenase [Cohaesibacter]TLP49299.1 homoserine dehydrogenase [Cohaesibacter sp. CAU 1516]
MCEPLKLGLAGLGTVGVSVIKRLEALDHELAQKAGRTMQITAITARSRNKDRGVELSAFEWFDDPVALAKSDSIDVFVELIGGDNGPAEASVRAALESGKHVVTANKALLAKHGNALARLAEENGVSLNFEAAVAGGIPVIKALREGLTSNNISRVYGIMNGTCNYILTRMEEDGISFEDCLADAQRLGYAEADPTFDIEGNDTAHKLAILTSLAFGTEIDAESIFLEGITSISIADIMAADDLGFRIKLLGVAQKTNSGIEQRVHPTMVPKESEIAQVSGVTNGVAIDGDAVGSITLAGPGAGGDATASAVVADIIDIARGLKVAPLGRPVSALKPYSSSSLGTHEGGYYIRLTVKNRPGAFASIASRMAECEISLESIVQRRGRSRIVETDVNSLSQEKPKDVILLTYETTEEAVRKALDAIEKDGHILASPQMIRIERL